MLKESEILKFIQEDTAGTYKHNAKIGRSYYEGLHDIRNYKLYYYNADGILTEDKTRTNIKISHPFFTELVDQCVQYLFSGDGNIVRTDIPELQNELDKYFDGDFMAELTDTVTDVCTGGFGTMYAYKSVNDRLSFQYADSLGVVFVRAKDTEDKTDYVIYWFTEKVKDKEVKHIQVWDSQQTYYYIQKDSTIELDKDEPLNPRPHIVYKKDGDDNIYYDNFGFVPFFRIDANRKRTSHLMPIKDLIDDYDLMACGLSNNLQDVSEALYVVKGFQGDNLEELIQNVKTKKYIGTEPDGGVDIKTIDLPYDARVKKLEIDEKNIYRFGMGFNSAQMGDGNITNIVIKSRYALLDLKCNKLESKVKQFLKKLVKVCLDEINGIHGTGYKVSDVYFCFDRKIMTNALDNAQIEKTNAETKQTQINTLISLIDSIPEEQFKKDICGIMEWDYEELKGDFPVSSNPIDETNNVDTLLGDE